MIRRRLVQKGWIPSRLTPTAWCITSAQLRHSHNEIGADDDILTVEFMETDNPFLGSQPFSATHSFTEFETLPATIVADSFARARVANFVKRYSKNAPHSPFHTVEEEGTFHCKVHLPMPNASYGERCGEGRASDPKEAEHLASMHAERIINALGLQLCALPSAQERYAAGVRKAGGWAPLPSDEPRAPHTPSPPGLQRSSTPSLSQKGSATPQALLFNVHDDSQFTHVTRGSGGARGVLERAIASPTMLDINAYRRVRSMVEDRGVSYSKAVRMVKLSTKKSREDGSLTGTVVRRDDGQDDESKQRVHTAIRKGSIAADLEASSKGDLYLCEILLFEAWIDPLSPYYNPDGFEGSGVPGGRKLLDSGGVASLVNGGGGGGLFQPLHAATPAAATKLYSSAEKAGCIVCRGVAFDSRTAQHLAAMHAELVADALGIALFANPSEQYEHYIECTKVGRWCLNPESHRAQITPLDVNSGTTPRMAAHAVKPLKLSLRAGEEPTQHQQTIAADEAVGGDGQGASLFQTKEVVTAQSSSPDARNVNAHLAAVQRLTQNFVSIGMVDPDATRHLKQYLRGFGYSGTHQEVAPTFINLNTGDINFLVSQFGLSGPHNAGATTFRASLRIPTPNDAYFGPRYAVGVASSAEEACDLCAMHALTVLGAFQIPVYTDSAQQSQYYSSMMEVGGSAAHPDAEERASILADLEQMNTNESISELSVTHVPSPSCFKAASRDKRGRIFFGISRADEALEWGDQQHRKKAEGAYQAELSGFRARMKPSFWALDPDVITPSGPRIVIPSGNIVDGKRTFIHTSSGVRYPDSRAADRLADYLERCGRQGDSYTLTTFDEIDEVVSKDGCSDVDGTRRLVTWHRLVVVLPVPDHFGHREAVGEGPSPEQALQCAAMHAELLLDDIGVRLYDHDVYQRQHAECARSVGRWAPLPETLIDVASAATKPSPCPIRFGVATTQIDSFATRAIEGRDASASEYLVSLSGAVPAASNTTAQGLSRSDISHIPSAPKAPSSATSSPIPTSNLFTDGKRYIADLETHLKSVPKDAQSGWEPDDAQGGDVEDNVDLSRFTTVSLQETGLSARNRVEQFFEENNGDITAIDRYSAKVDGRHLHFASVVLPLPPQFGIRKARGCAVSRRDALVNCMNHAEFVIGDLGIPIHGGRRNAQVQYHHAMKRKGRRAPMPGDPLQPPTTLSTYGLKTIQDGSEDVVVPLFSQEQLEEAGVVASSSSSLEDSHSTAVMEDGAHADDLIEDAPIVDAIATISTKADYALPAVKQAMDRWEEHCIKVSHFITKRDKQRLVVAAQQVRSPRTGVPIEDSATDAMEALIAHKGLNRSAFSALQAASARDGYEIPASFDVMEIGFGSTRAFYSSATVIGTPYTAHGLAEKRHDALCTAMTHYKCIQDLVTVAHRKAKTAAAAGLTRAVGDSQTTLDDNEEPDIATGNGATPTHLDGYDLGDAFAVASVMGWGDLVLPQTDALANSGTDNQASPTALPPALELRRLAYMRSAPAKAALYDDVKECFSLRGKLLIISLFIKTFVDGSRGGVREMNRVIDPDDGTNKVTVMCSLGLEDEVGLKLAAKGKEVVGKPPPAGEVSEEASLVWNMYTKGVVRRKAYEELFSVLSPKRQFQDLMQLVKENPNIQLEFATGINMPTDLVSSVKTVVLGEKPPTASIPSNSQRPATAGKPSCDSAQTSVMDALTYTSCRRSYLNSIARKVCDQLSAPTPSGAGGAFLSGTIAKEAMPEEYAQLLASFASGRPLADVGGLEDACRDILGADLLPTTTDERGTADTSPKKVHAPLFSIMAPDRLRDAVSALLDEVDAKCVNVGTRQLLDLHQSHFVEVVEISLADLDSALRPVAKHQQGVSTLHSKGVDAAANQQPQNAVSGPLTQLRKVTLKMAIPTLNGGLCIRLASLLLRHYRKTADDDMHGDGEYTRAEIVLAVATSKMLFNGLVAGAYDMALTACALDESGFESLVAHFTNYPDQVLLTRKINAGDEGGGGVVDGSFGVSDIVLAATDAIQKAASVSASSRKISQLNLQTARRALHDLVIQSLKELSGSVVLSRVYPQLKELLSIAQRTESPQSAFAMKAQNVSNLGISHLLLRRAVFDATVAVSLSPAFSLTTLRGVRKLLASQRRIEELKEAQVRNTQQQEAEKKLKEEQAKQAASEAAAAAGMAEYVPPKGGVLRVTPEPLVALVKEAHGSTGASPLPPTLAKPTPPTVSPNPASPTPTAAAKPSSWAALQSKQQHSSGGGWGVAASRPQHVATTGKPLASSSIPPLTASSRALPKSTVDDSNKIVSLGMEEHQYAKMRLPLLSKATKRTAAQSSVANTKHAVPVFRPEIFLESPSVLALLTSDSSLREPLSVVAADPLAHPSHDEKVAPSSRPCSSSSPISPKGRLLCVGGQMLLFTTKEADLVAFELVRQKALEQIRTVRPWGEPFKALMKSFVCPNN